MARGKHSVGNAQAQTLLPCKLPQLITFEHPLRGFRQHFRHIYPSTALLANLGSLPYALRVDALSCFQAASADDWVVSVYYPAMNWRGGPFHGLSLRCPDQGSQLASATDAFDPPGSCILFFVLCVDFTVS